jgi:urea carboxylase
VIDLTPGIRSLQIHFQPETLTPERCWLGERRVGGGVRQRRSAGADPGGASAAVVGRPCLRTAIDKYMTTVRRDAPWCPSNLEFIRRINDLPDEQAVWQTVFDASYLVMGLGDVYLGAPVATPLDPRHRLVTTKYNPARTWTAENSVGSAAPICASTVWKDRGLPVCWSYAADVESLS